jgi:prophage regulatory protein
MTKQEPRRTRAGDRIATREVDYGVEDRLLPIDAVMQIAGIGKTMIYQKMRAGTFPKSCSPGGASTRWSEREVRAWLAEVLASRAA